ncbi:MAG: ABC transporter permease [Filifactor alocis]|nr:ABC transporter permease [Filifactor alocis]
MLRELVIRDIKVRYRKSFLGILWTVLNPLMMMAVLTVVFSTIFRSNIENFPVYYLTGSLLFSFNSEATTQAQTAIIGNASLIKKVYIPKYLFPLSRVMSSLVNLCFSFIALLIVMVVTKSTFHPTMIFAVYPIICLMMFTTGLSLVLSVYTVFFRDLVHLYGVFTLIWMYLTPLFYPLEMLPPEAKSIVEMNPLYHFIVYFRHVILDGHIPTLMQHISLFFIGFMFLIVGIVVFIRRQDKFILYI